MPTYNSSLITNSVPARANVGETEVYAEVTLTANAANGDILKFCNLPAGARVLDAKLTSDDLDSGANSITIDVGDAGDTDRIIAASTAAQAGTAISSLAKAGHGYKYSSETLIYGTIGNVGTGATGTVKLSIRYQMGTIL